MAKNKRNRKNKITSTDVDNKPAIKTEQVKEEETDQKQMIAFSMKKVKKTKKIIKTESSQGNGKLKRYFNKSGKVKREQAVRGVVYVSSLPHGFYEKQLEGYFGQFGKVTGVYVPKSKKTGRAKGFAFIEYLHPEVAQIAAETMNNYLMFNRLIKTKVIPPENQRPFMFSDRYKNMKHQYSESKAKSAINKKRSQLIMERDSCVARSMRKLTSIQDCLKSIGIDYKIKVAGLHEAVTLTGIKNIDPEYKATASTKEETSKEPQETKSKSTRSKKKTKAAQVSPAPVKVKVEASGSTTVAITSSASGKNKSARSMVKTIAKQQFTAGKEKVAKLVKTIGKSKLKAQKSKLKKTVQNLQQSLKPNNAKKNAPSTSKIHTDLLTPKSVSASPIKKKRNTRPKLETTV